mmetsp:Transcript_1654/g.1852  ORF Transcript_1654/g.1852 Transcript_1654/m.1852 type:complete len:87 (+) Transcript_1654:72-332(+)
MKHRKVLIGLVLVLLCSLTIYNYRYFDIFSVTKLQDVKLKFQGTLPSHNMSSSSSSSSTKDASTVLVGFTMPLRVAVSNSSRMFRG